MVRDKIKGENDLSAQPEPLTEPLSSTGIRQLYQQHSRMILRTAWRITGSQDDAEDVLQLIFLRLMKNPSAHPAALTGGYLRRAAANASLDIVRKRQKQPEQAALEQLAPPREAESGETPEEVLRTRDLADALSLALSQLNKRAAEVFILREIEGLSSDETAALLGTTPNTVTVTLHRARTKLLEMLSSRDVFTS